jgi:hypothetical protein
MTPLDTLLAQDTPPAPGEILTATVRTLRRFAEKHGKDTGTFFSATDSAMQRLALAVAMEASKHDDSTHSVLDALLNMTGCPATDYDAATRYDDLMEAARVRGKEYLSLVGIEA